MTFDKYIKSKKAYLVSLKDKLKSIRASVYFSQSSGPPLAKWFMAAGFHSGLLVYLN